MNHLSILVLSVPAFACLALAMERHQEDLFGRPLDPVVTKALRAAGWMMLVASLVVALRQPLWAVGLVAWFAWLSAGAGVMFATLLLASRLRTVREAGRRE
jgi:uncharacterized membrane protein